MKRGDLIVGAIKTSALGVLMLTCLVVWVIVYKVGLDVPPFTHKNGSPEFRIAMKESAETAMIVGSVTASLFTVAGLKVIGFIKRSRELKDEK